MKLSVIFLFLATLPASAESLHMNRNESLVNAFQIMCFLEDPVYDRIDARASAMRMSTVDDRLPKGPPGATVKRRIRMGSLTDGPFFLHLSEVAFNSQHAASCGVSGLVPNADQFRADVVRVMRLLPLPVPTETPNGGRVYIWNNFPRQDHRLILQEEMTKDGTPNVMMTYSVKSPR